MPSQLFSPSRAKGMETRGQAFGSLAGAMPIFPAFGPLRRGRTRKICTPGKTIFRSSRAHTLKFGAIYSRNSKNEQQSNAEFGGLFGAVGYNGCSGKVVAGQCPNASGNQTGYDVANVLLKNMAFNWSEASNININDIRWRNTEFYAADTFRLSSRLTVVYGVRYSQLPNPYFDDNLYTSV